MFEGVPDVVTQTAKRSAGRGRSCAQLGELSSARQALEGAEVAVGNQETLEALRRRPSQFRDQLPESIVHHTPPSSSWMKLGWGAT